MAPKLRTPVDTAIVGLAIAIIRLFAGKGFGFVYLFRSAVVGTLAGGLAELLGRCGDLLKRAKLGPKSQ